MIKLLLLLPSLISFQTLATSNWQSVVEGENYKLKESLTIPSKGKILEIKRGTSLKLVKSTSLNMIKVNHQKYQIKNCKNSMQESELELIPVPQKGQGSVSVSVSVSVGVNLLKGCFLEIFVENKDIESNNIFI
jgi:hypothetical protein